VDDTFIVWLSTVAPTAFGRVRSEKMSECNPIVDEAMLD
jgi:hypothetical protein